MANRLARESSLYLRQHGENPVDWYPWCDEAFERARQENRPVFLSIGYSSCHWCHVMAHETFADKAIARILNGNFVCIKVDREERPDLDRKYMLFVQAMTGSGGWPLNVFLTPDGEPFFGGTYFPPRDMGRMPSFLKVLKMVLKTYREKRTEDLASSFRALTKRIDKLMEAQEEDADFDPGALKAGFESMKEGFDYVNGGLIGSPKFPQHTFIRFLLRHSKRFRDPASFDHAVLTLNRMARGGVYDQVGGGLHRYSVDASWLVPHFEKMLYDQAQFLISLCDLYKAFREEWIARYIEKTASFLLEEMFTGKGFASALDADTPEGEGAYYTWTTGDLGELFKGPDLKFVIFYFDISPDGNFEKGKNVLAVPFDDEIVQEKLGLEPSAFREKLDGILKKLGEKRRKRRAPGRDEKAVTSWNGQTCAALLQAWEVTGQHDIFEHAEILLDQFMDMADTEKVPRVMGREEQGFLDDHVFAARALMQAFFSTEDDKYLWAAEKMVRLVIDRFYEEEKGALSYIDLSGGIQMDDVFDHELPSATSEFIILLLELHSLLLMSEFHEMAQKLLAVHQKSWRSPSPGASRLLCALDTFIGPQQVAVITDGKHFDTMLAALREVFDPNLRVLVQNKDADLPIFDDRKPVSGKATVYICVGQTCREPITDPGELEAVFHSEAT